MHIGSVLLLIWLVIGGVAAGQRGDFNGPMGCSSAGTIAVTLLAGPPQLYRRASGQSTARCGTLAISHDDSGAIINFPGFALSELPGWPALTNLPS